MFTSQLRLVAMIAWIGCLALVLSISFGQEPEEPPVSSSKRTATPAENPGDAEKDGELLPSASQVIEKYIMAMGGYEFLSSIESAHFVFKGTSSNGTKIESEYYQSRGRYYCEMFRNNLSMIRGVWSDGTTDENGLRIGFAWQYVNDGALVPKMGDELQEYLRRRSRVISSPHWETDFKSIKCIAKQPFATNLFGNFGLLITMERKSIVTLISIRVTACAEKQWSRLTGARLKSFVST